MTLDLTVGNIDVLETKRWVALIKSGDSIRTKEAAVGAEFGVILEEDEVGGRLIKTKEIVLIG